jgi:geranylgeranylglycerol-phosphate geranylgeranyltransferase
MNKAIAFYKLGRPLNALSGALAVIIGGYVAATGAWGNVLIAAVVTFIVTASSNAWNDYLDIEIDRINQPRRILPAGHLSCREALTFSLVLAGISLLLAAFINLPAFLITLFCNIILYLYSWRLKSTVLLGNATIATMSAVSVIFGAVSAGNVRPSLLLAVIAATVIMAREILKTMADYEGDLSQQVSTVATVWGRKAAANLFLLIATAGLVLVLMPYLLSQFELIYVIISLVGIYPVMFYVLTQVRHNTPAARLEHLSQLIKYDFLVWFVAVLLGANVT